VGEISAPVTAAPVCSWAGCLVGRERLMTGGQHRDDYPCIGRAARHVTDFAAYLIVYHAYEVRGLAGTPSRRLFILSKPIDPAVAAAFQTSQERRLLDTVRNLKVSLAAG
jgi:hypothetical protein